MTFFICHVDYYAFSLACSLKALLCILRKFLPISCSMKCKIKWAIQFPFPSRFESSMYLTSTRKDKRFDYQWGTAIVEYSSIILTSILAKLENLDLIMRLFQRGYYDFGPLNLKLWLIHLKLQPWGSFKNTKTRCGKKR